jgi:inosose dehydratase
MSQKLHVAVNDYAWKTFYQREGRDMAAHLDQALGEIAGLGFAGYEPNVLSLEMLQDLAPRLESHQLALHSIYVNSTLHTPEQVDESIERILAVAGATQPLGTRIVVTNPSPIRWGGDEAKNDDQLRCQADALNRLGAELHKLGMVLAYHNHDPEMRHAAREFHHMMLATDPELVSLCLDPHWIYRGADDSQIALFDILKLYGSRVVEIHIRQSNGGVWDEVFGPGDIDYPRLVEVLRSANVEPHLVMEQCVEKATPHTLNAVEAHRQGLEYVDALWR